MSFSVCVHLGVTVSDKNYEHYLFFSFLCMGHWTQSVNFSWFNFMQSCSSLVHPFWPSTLDTTIFNFGLFAESSVFFVPENFILFLKTSNIIVWINHTLHTVAYCFTATTFDLKLHTNFILELFWCRTFTIFVDLVNLKGIIWVIAHCCSGLGVISETLSRGSGSDLSFCFQGLVFLIGRPSCDLRMWEPADDLSPLFSKFTLVKDWRHKRVHWLWVFQLLYFTSGMRKSLAFKWLANLGSLIKK